MSKVVKRIMKELKLKKREFPNDYEIHEGKVYRPLRASDGDLTEEELEKIDLELQIENLTKALESAGKDIEEKRKELDILGSKKIAQILKKKDKIIQYKTWELKKLKGLIRIIYSSELELGKEEKYFYKLDSLEDIPSKLVILKGIKGKHEELKAYAKNRLKREGYSIQEEKQMTIAGYEFRIDLVGIKSKEDLERGIERIAVECGNCELWKLKLLTEMFDKVVWIPYKSCRFLKH